MKPLLSICITSYKRVRELKRCLESIDSKAVDSIEIIVSEDCSPQKELIREVVSQYKRCSLYSIIFNTNEHNLGYDRNLIKLVSLASGEYIMFLSDDDCLFAGSLDVLLDILSTRSPAMVYAPFWYGYDEAKEAKRKHQQSHKIKNGENDVSKRVYDAILFSGLTFRKDYIKDIDGERFVNLNYIQVYMFLSVIYQHGGYYLDTLMIDSVSDGENAYGQVDSSNGQNHLLANRESVFSNIEFNKGLFKVIKMFDEDYGTHVFEVFSKEYSLRSLYGLCRARKFGLNTYKDYWNRIKSSEIILSPISKIYYVIVLLLGGDLSRKLFVIPRRILSAIRKHN